MPKGKTDTKRFEKQGRRHVRNRSGPQKMKTFISRAREAEGEDEGEEAVKRALQALDKAAKKGVIHPNNAARRKSRLMKRLNEAAA